MRLESWMWKEGTLTLQSSKHCKDVNLSYVNNKHVTTQHKHVNLSASIT